MIARELIREPQVLLRHVATQAMTPRALRSVMRVGALCLGSAQLLMAVRAQGVALGAFEREQGALCVFPVWVVTIDAAELRAAISEQEIARFTGVDRGASGIVPARAPFPGVGIAREEHRVTLGAGAIDVLCMARFGSSCARYAHEIAAQRERWAHCARV